MKPDHIVHALTKFKGLPEILNADGFVTAARAVKVFPSLVEALREVAPDHPLLSKDVEL